MELVIQAEAEQQPPTPVSGSGGGQCKRRGRLDRALPGWSRWTSLRPSHPDPATGGQGQQQGGCITVHVRKCVSTVSHRQERFDSVSSRALHRPLRNSGEPDDAAIRVWACTATACAPMYCRPFPQPSALLLPLPPVYVTVLPMFKPMMQHHLRKCMLVLTLINQNNILLAMQRCSVSSVWKHRAGAPHAHWKIY